MPEPRFCALLVGTHFWQGLKVFNLLMLLEKEISMQERRKSKHKFGGAKVCKAEEVWKYFVNSEIENKVFR